MNNLLGKCKMFSEYDTELLGCMFVYWWGVNCKKVDFLTLNSPCARVNCKTGIDSCWLCWCVWNNTIRNWVYSRMRWTLKCEGIFPNSLNPPSVHTFSWFIRIVQTKIELLSFTHPHFVFIWFFSPWKTKVDCQRCFFP